MPQELNNQKASLLLLTVATSFIALIPTAWIAYVSDSVVLRADFYRCFSEFLAIFVSWMVLRLIDGKDSVVYNFGLGKLEHLSSLVVASALVFTFVITLFSGYARLSHPVPVSQPGLSLVFALLSVAGNVYIWHRSAKYLVKEHSTLIDSQKRLFQAKTFASLVVFVTLLLAVLLPADWGAVYVDPIGSFGVAAFLLYSAYSLVSSSVAGLLDRALEEALQMKIYRILLMHEALYDGFKSMRSRFAGSDIFIDIFLEFASNTSIKQVDEAREKLTQAVTTELPGAKVLIVASSM